MTSTHLCQRTTLQLDPFAQRSGSMHGADLRYAAGDRIAGRYQLDALLGSGGMGTVWRGRDLTTQAPIAIKIATSSDSRDELVARMRAEAELETQLRHPGIVRALGFGLTRQGDPYIVMELLEGRCLRQTLAERGRLSPDEATRLLLPIAEALCFVHAAGVIHRDIKPDNIFIAQAHGIVPKILDFGIAKRRVGRRFTREGLLVGSPGYMAPEQARAQSDLDERVDVWAFSLVLFEAVAGSAALHQPELATMLPHEALAADVRPSLEDMGGSEALLSIVQRGLARDREQRFASMWQLSRALRLSLTQRPRRRRFVSYPLAA